MTTMTLEQVRHVLRCKDHRTPTLFIAVPIARLMADAIESAIAELAAKDAEVGRLRSHMKEIRLYAEIERLRADAERYRWLRQMIYDDRIIVAADQMLAGDSLDLAIDTARAEK